MIVQVEDKVAARVKKEGRREGGGRRRRAGDSPRPRDASGALPGSSPKLRTLLVFQSSSDLPGLSPGVFRGSSKLSRPPPGSIPKFAESFLEVI